VNAPLKKKNFIALSLLRFDDNLGTAKLASFNNSTAIVGFAICLRIFAEAAKDE